MIKKTTTKRVTTKSATKKSAGGTPRQSASEPVRESEPSKLRTPKTALSGGNVQNSSSFLNAESMAEEYLKDPKKLGKLFAEAANKAKETPKGPFGETWAYFQAMLRLIRAHANGTYRETPVGSLLMILVAVIYFVSPFDFIPDAIPVAGFIDDALVVSLTVKQVKADLDAFMAWEVEAAFS